MSGGSKTFEHVDVWNAYWPEQRAAFFELWQKALQKPESELKTTDAMMVAVAFNTLGKAIFENPRQHITPGAKNTETWREATLHRWGHAMALLSKALPTVWGELDWRHLPFEYEETAANLGRALKEARPADEISRLKALATEIHFQKQFAWDAAKEGVNHYIAAQDRKAVEQAVERIWSALSRWELDVDGQRLQMNAVDLDMRDADYAA
jgi:hypothetical protein